MGKSEESESSEVREGFSTEFFKSCDTENSHCITIGSGN